MFDLSRLAESVGSLFGGNSATDVLSGGSLVDLMANAGIDPSVLDGLTQTEIMDLLAQNGIDLSQVSETQIAEVLNSFGAGEHVQSLLGGFGFGDGADRG